MPTISNSSGSFVGTELENDVSAFLGIQYASAKRFCQPTDIKKYSSIVNAQTFGPQSPQVPGFMDEILNTKSLPTSEECLYLNIWKPTRVRERLPVLFWIHGGAYTNGTAATSWYDGANLVRLGDVVVVSINYRLGPFGFIGDNNLGTLDQISALRWVNRNIEAFGGDPSNVTIFGESAGGSSVVALTASDLTRGMFAKAWAMSPSLLQLRSIQDAQQAKQKFLEAAKCSSFDRLSAMSTQEIVDATRQMFVDAENYISTFTPTAGGAGLPLDIYAASAKSKIPMVVGTNRDENRLWTALNPSANQMSEQDARKIFEAACGQRAASAWNIISRNREALSPAQMVAALQTEINFRVPAQKLCERRATSDANSWMYWFTWQTPVFDGAFGCCHALDLPFVFNNLDKPNVEMFTGSDPSRREISSHFTSELIQFAKYGTVSWPIYSADERHTLKIDIKTELVVDPDSEIRQIWADR